MSEMIFLLTKDCMSLESLPIYGNRVFSTPNINELASKGTVFNRHYTSAPGTSMALTAMLSGHYPYEFTDRKIYRHVKPSEFPSIFDHYQNEGYETHLIWDVRWMDLAWPFIREFGDEEVLKLHNLDICQPTGAGKDNDTPIVRDELLIRKTINTIEKELSAIDTTKNQFIFMHLPHVLQGRRCYMDDMEAFDEIVGFIRSFAGDNNIYLSTDHGHMNMHKGEVGYGFNVYEPVIHIPLITPRLNGLKEVNYLTCNVDIPKLLINGEIPEREYVISESQYYFQPKRVTSIIKGNLKYIYNKETGNEELYDILWDPYENYNILQSGYFDDNRKKFLLYDEYYYYPQREDTLKRIDEFRQIKNSFWVEPTKKQVNEYSSQIKREQQKKRRNEKYGPFIQRMRDYYTICSHKLLK